MTCLQKIIDLEEKTMLKFDTLKNDYPSRRSVIYGRKGMVCTSQPLAAQAGLDIIKQGGNAIDAAIATAACMTVLEPTSNGIGSDAFALVWTKGELHGLNASGRAPMAITAEKVKKQGYTAMPKRGWIPVMVPGAPSAWAELSEKFGRLTLEKVMEPAVTYAREGYPVSPVISKIWNNAYKEFIDTLKDESFKPWFDTFARDGHAPQPGEIWKSEAHAKTLEKIAKTHAKAFYQGELGEYIAEDLESTQPLKLLSWYPNGAREFTSNKKLESLDDFNGQKLRMPNNPIHVKLAESLGANVVIMDMGEVFTALEQGVADGQDNPLATVKTEGWYEVQDYVYDTNHIISSLELFAGEEFWNSLSEEDQKAFEEASQAASDYAWDLYEEQLSDDKQFMKDNGLVVTELSDEDREVMKEKIQPVYDYLNAQYDWVDDVRKMVDDIKVE